jgi:hypothetical protein
MEWNGYFLHTHVMYLNQTLWYLQKSDVIHLQLLEALKGYENTVLKQSQCGVLAS